MMNGQYVHTVFTVYFALVGLAGLISFFLSRKAKNVEKKKRIDTIGFVFVAVLMLGLSILLHLPVPGIGILIVVFFGMFFLTKKFTFYCPHCLKKTQHLFDALEYCPKCGQVRKNGDKI